jgi:hypothetical protein
MAAPYPVVVPEAFALLAAGPDRNVIPTAPLPNPQRASFNLGFPPITMTPVAAGGKPMLGPDMNGIFYMLSTHTFYQQSGKLYLYNADVVVAIGGYAIGTLLGSADGLTVWYNLVAGNTNDPDAGGAGWLAWFSYGITPIAGLVGGVRVLTTAEYAKSVIVLTGALVANQQIVLPTQIRRWLIVNSTTGAFNVTVKTAAGAGVIVPPGGSGAPAEVWGDGINIYNVVAPVNLPIDQAPTPLTIPQRTNLGYLYATYFNQNSALENPAMSAVFIESGGDGFHRKISPLNFQAQLVLSNFIGQVTNAQVPQSAVTQHAAAVLANAALTGVPTTPTAAPGTNTAQVASTAFVRANQLKVACGRVQAGVLQAGSIGVNSITPAGPAGAFNIDVTAAGFSAIPNATASITAIGLNPDTACINATSTVNLSARTVFGANPVARDFNFIAIGL